MIQVENLLKIRPVGTPVKWRSLFDKQIFSVQNINFLQCLLPHKVSRGRLVDLAFETSGSPDQFGSDN